MKDFAHSKKEFESWKGNEQKRGAFLSALGEVIRRHLLDGFAFSLNMDHYREINRHIRLEESLPPYTLAATWAIAKVREWQRHHRADDELLFLIEAGDVGQAVVRRKFESESRVRVA